MYLPRKPRLTSVQQPIDLVKARSNVRLGIATIIFSVIVAGFSTLHLGLQRSRGSKSYVTRNEKDAANGGSTALSHTRVSRTEDGNHHKTKASRGLADEDTSRRSNNQCGSSARALPSSTTPHSHAAPERKRVVIIGAGPAGSALAALLARETHLDITVIDKDTHHTFRGIEPLAHVGHRSYDLNTSGGVDYLHASSAWTVTRDARLVHGTVTRVLPQSQQVMVRMAASEAAAAAAACSDTHTYGPVSNPSAPAPSTRNYPCEPSCPSRADSDLDRVISRWRRMLSGPRACEGGGDRMCAPDGSAHTSRLHMETRTRATAHDPRGVRVYDYDVLILACGASRSLGSLGDMIDTAEVDRYRIALHPGTTRDALAHTYRGNILHVKVPSRLTAARVAAQRQARIAQNLPVRRLVLPFDDAAGGDAVLAAMADALTPMSSNQAGTRCVGESGHTCQEHSRGSGNVTFSNKGDDDEHHDSNQPQQTPPGARFWSSEETATCLTGYVNGLIREGRRWLGAWTPLRTDHCSGADDAHDNSDPAGTAAAKCWMLDALPCPMTVDGCSCLVCSPLLPTHPYEGGFVSTTNTVWKYLDYHNKWTLCRYYSVSADAEPLCGVPEEINDEVRALWSARQQRSRLSSGKDVRSHFLSHTCVVDVDCRASVVTLYNFRYHVEVVMPFRLMLLDLPLKAPDFVRASGLHRLRETHRRHDTANDRVHHTRVGAENGLRRVAAALPDTAYEEEDGFADVDEHSLRHRRYGNIFALGDVAGLPTLKSYGAVFAQVPVVRHNVLHTLSHECPPPSSLPNTPQSQEERGLARYDGYSSFHIVMTTWRAMWPEVRYGAAQRGEECVQNERTPHTEVQQPSQDLHADGHASRHDETASGAHTASHRLEGCNYHLWNNLSWRGVGGFVNALYYQTSLYEVMYFFLFMRGLWHPPSWFVVPAYSSVDGTPVRTSNFLTNWL